MSHPVAKERRCQPSSDTANQIEWLSANEEEEARIAQANAPLDDKGNFKNEYVLCRERGDFPLLRPEAE